MKKNIIEEQSINDNNYKKLKELFPDAVSIDEDGKYIIDKEKLQMNLDPSKAEICEDGYGLNWVGKKEAYHRAFSKNYKVLKPLNDEANSKNWDTTENILIKGDNLDALKILRHNYFEAIKMIYIDPPYNTKNDGFVYNDNFTSSTEQTLEELGYDKEYIDYIENIQGAKTHSGWLSFMYPRLLLARDLLKEDGVIFISLDDNEQAQLKILCDEVFGEENFIETLIWKKRATPPNDRNIGRIHEYIHCYAKNLNLMGLGLLDRDDKSKERYSNPDKDIRGDWAASDLSANGKGGRLSQSCIYPIKNPENGLEYMPSEGRCWLFNKEKMEKYILEGRVAFRENTNTPFLKRYLSEVRQGLTLPTILTEFGFSSTSATEADSLFNKKGIFEYAKPTTLIKPLLQVGTVSNKNDLILDFFAGSGTTAHAVMDLNAKDGGNRKFICVQWAEETPEKSEAKKAGYETIFDITKERIKRAGEKILGETLKKNGLLHSVRNDEKDGVCNDGDSVSNDGGLDVGFRTFEVVEDVKQKIYQKSLEEMTQDDLLSFMSKPTIENNEEILYNLFLAENLPLSTKYETLIKNRLYLANNVAFVLGDITSDELVEKLKEKKECEYITVYSPNISDDKFTLEIESNISKIGIKSDKLRFRG